MQCKKCGKVLQNPNDKFCPNCGNDVTATIATTTKDALTSVASKAVCKIGGHRWNGCKCTRCGETRDEGHIFQPVAGKCKQKCSVCGKTESLPHQWSGDKCTRCGASKGFSDKLWDPVSKRLPFLHLEKKDNRIIAGMGIFLVLMFAFFGIMAGLESTPASEEKDMTEKVAYIEESREVDSVQESNLLEESKAYTYDGKPYEIVDSYIAGIGLKQYWVYTEGFDYSIDAFREQVKAIITDVAYKENTNTLIVDIVTDKEIIYFESDNTIAEAMDKYGIDYFMNTIAPKEKTNWVATYRGGYDFDIGKKSDENSAFEIIWLIADYTERDDMDFEQWKPNLTK